MDASTDACGFLTELKMLLKMCYRVKFYIYHGNAFEIFGSTMSSLELLSELKYNLYVKVIVFILCHLVERRAGLKICSPRGASSSSPKFFVKKFFGVGPCAPVPAIQEMDCGGAAPYGPE